MNKIRTTAIIILLMSNLYAKALSFRYYPYFPLFNSQYVVRGIILENDLFYYSSYVDLYSPTIRILNDYDLEIIDPLVLLPDTTGIPLFETGWYLKPGEEYIIDFRINKYGQLCYSRFLKIINGKVSGNLTNWNELMIRTLNIRPRGMRIERFERKLKRKMKRMKMAKIWFPPKNSECEKLVYQTSCRA